MAASEPLVQGTGRDGAGFAGVTAGDGPGGVRPYVGRVERHPLQPPVPLVLDPDAVERRAPVFGAADVSPLDADLTLGHRGEPLGERITVGGRVLDGRGRPVRGQLVELWQANAAGRYVHRADRHAAPLDPNFTGAGRCLTDDDGRYRFTTIRPGAYPDVTHHNAWRPSHLHFSLFGTAFTQRLVTQMYFPGDPLLPHDSIWTSVRDASARRRLVAAYDPGLNEPERSLGYRWDIVLDGPDATWAEEGR
ncbi:protocatechuate 3,4-dioxygenase subunit beta [Streptomyces netropsis]|uniref:Protocatechuate 3,4-dioxygenase beta subunit n=1 Tax=Streptomyces netropsis TaxID=55404 RepID=A0A7W7LGU3_STRNE|nr:protocatechuate 3,4-dioxygenase subunit beta [Streptomyces netropsis]MBB4889965.1 protocatechuate 3,4-dioxygenase beta subunit [Streptomyces netropsis]GGR42864.1 protocatechuate 3,4-dioxygenase subunit beta [Streptomyces netropsis]